MRRQLRGYGRHLAAIGALLVLALVVGGYILVNQRLRLPWDDRYTVKAEFSSATAVTPGQGQTVTVAGIEVGDIVGVQLRDGRAVVKMQVDPELLPAVYRDATMLLRPRTPLADQTVQLEPGSPGSGKLGDRTLPVSHTQANVSVDEVTSALDADTRAYLRVLLNAGAGGLKGRAIDVRRVFASSAPLLRGARSVTGALATRRRELRRVVHNLGELSAELAGRDDSLRGLVSGANATFGALASEERALGESVERLPGTLRSADRALATLRPFARELQPALTRLTPTARALQPALVRTRPFFREGAPDLRRLRRLAVTARPLLRDARPLLRDLDPLTPDLTRSFDVLRYVTNQLAYVPPAPDKSYLFWLAWFAHNTNSMLSNGDAHGGYFRALANVSCDNLTFGGIGNLQITAPIIAALLQVSGATGLCPGASPP